MGAVHRHSFEIVRKGYDPGAVDQTILELTIARNDADAMIARLHEQVEHASHGVSGNGFAQVDGTADRVIAEAKAEARRLIDEAHGQAESIVGGARGEAGRVLAAGGGSPGATPATAAELARLVQIAETFEQQLTKIARGALGDVTSLSSQLRSHLQTAASEAPTTAARQQVAASTAPPPGGEHGQSLAQRIANERATEPTDLPAGGEHGKSLAQRIANERAAPSTDSPAVASATAPGEPATDGDAGSKGTLETLRRIAAQQRAEDGPVTPAATVEQAETAAEAPRNTTEDTATEEPTRGQDRRSYYSRRSAHLPRIGEEATASAMAAIRSVRKSGEGADSEEDMAAQTA